MAKTKPARKSRKRASTELRLLPPRMKRPEDLTTREQEILQLLWFGSTNREVGHHLGISVKTVEAHRANMMKKVRVSNTAGLLKAGLQNGVISV